MKLDFQSSEPQEAQNGIQQDEEEPAEPFWTSIWESIKYPELFFLLMYFPLDSVTSPSFPDFSYYFLINELNLSKFTFAAIGIYRQLLALITTIAFGSYMKGMEARHIIRSCIYV